MKSITLTLILLSSFAQNSYEAQEFKKIFSKQLKENNNITEVDSFYSFPNDLEDICEREFEVTRDGGKRFLKQCCENITYDKYNTFLRKFGINVAETGAVHNINSNDKRFFRCGVSLEWIDPEKSNWVEDEANLEECAEERILLEQEQEKYKPKGTVINSTFLGFCANDFKKYACAMGRQFWCE